MSGQEFPAITMWQPHASLIFTRHKRHETRGFALPERLRGQWVAIHAAARSVRPAELSEGLDLLCRMQWGSTYETSLPHRRVLGLVRFDLSRRTDGYEPGRLDRLCGNWSPGRFAWRVADLFALADPPLATGRQGWWRVTLDPAPRLDG